MIDEAKIGWNHARHVQLQGQVGTLATVNFVANLSLGVVHQYLALALFNEYHKARHQDRHAQMNKAESACIEPVRTSSKSPPKALGRPATMPAKMMIEMPLPKPRSVICSPSHIRNMVPVRRVKTVTKRNIRPGSSTRPACDSKSDSNSQPLKQRQATVP
jgi:hypothetical protein